MWWETLFTALCARPTRFCALTHPLAALPKLTLSMKSSIINQEEAKTQRKMIWKYHGGTICLLDEGDVMTSSEVMYTVPNNHHKGVYIIEPAKLSSKNELSPLCDSQDDKETCIPCLLLFAIEREPGKPELRKL
jgi:hypothetical protein